jgi:hypothetical protein
MDQGLQRGTDGGATFSDIGGGVRNSILTGIAVSGSTILTGVHDFDPILSFDSAIPGRSLRTSPALPVGEDGPLLTSGKFCYAVIAAGLQYSSDRCKMVSHDRHPRAAGPVLSDARRSEPDRDRGQRPPIARKPAWNGELRSEHRNRLGRSFALLFEADDGGVLMRNTSGDSFSPNDKPVRCGTDEVKRIAGHQGEDLSRAGIQHRDVAWLHHPRRHDAIAVVAGDSGERDEVVLPYVSQGPKKRIAVSGDAYVAGPSRQRRTGDMACRAPQGSGSGPLDHHRRKAQTLDLDPADQAIR